MACLFVPLCESPYVLGTHGRHALKLAPFDTYTHAQAPVDPKALKLDDYFKIIKQPMDLGTVKAKLQVHHASFGTIRYSARVDACASCSRGSFEKCRVRGRARVT
jgi:hypothetical protein